MGFTPKQWKSLKRKLFPSQPAQKRTALSAMLGFGASYIGAEPAKDNSKKEILEAWARCYNELRRAGLGAVLSRGEGRWIGVPLGTAAGALVGCQVDGG